MSDRDVFEGGEETAAATENKTQETPATPVKSNDDVFADKLASIVNDNGEPKYKDVETALAALKESQDFIKTLQTEKKSEEQKRKELEEELAKMGNIEDFVNKISPNTPQNKPEATTDGDVKLSEEKILELINRTTSEREQAKQAANNLSMVVSKLSEKHGGNDKAAAFIQQKAKELNTTPAELKKLSMTNPTMALTLLGTSSSQTTSATSLKTNNQPTQTSEDGPPKYERGVARGGLSSKELAERWRAVGKHTHKRLGVEE